MADRYAREVGADHLWLDAMREAPWAWRTYEKWGFSEIGETTFAEGVKPEFSSARGLGEAEPIAPNKTAEGRAQNRRVEVTLAGQTTP